MKEKILGIFVCMLMIGSIFGSMNIVKSGPSDNTGWTVIERGANFVRRQNIDNPDIFSWESAPQWVYNGTAWVPYIFDETADYYQVQSGLIGTRIYKDGYAEFWNPDMTEVRLYEEMWTLEYYNSENGKWKACDVYSPTFSVDSDTTMINITASFITDYPNSGERAFDVKYIFKEGRPLKHEITFTSHSTEEYLFRVKQKWAGIVSTKVKHDSGVDAITELTTIDSSKFKFLKADGSLSVYENQWEMYYGYNETTHRRYILKNQNLKPVEIDVHAQGLKADFIFGNWTLSQNESLEIDPDTSTLDDPTEDGFVLYDDGWLTKVTDEDDIIFGGDEINDYRGYVEWDISSLAGATLTASPIFKYEGMDDSAEDEKIKPLTEGQPSILGSQMDLLYLYIYIASGTAYVDPFDLVVDIDQEEDLGASAKSDLQNAMDISQSWFAIGFVSIDGEEEPLLSVVAAEEYENVMPPPILYVEYTPSNTAPTQTGESPTDESIGTSITPPLYVICNDVDGEDTLTATWRSNSSGSWVTFATNTSISPGTNITQTNSNFSSYNTIYYWSVNLTDGTDWTNKTYKFTIAVTINCGYIHLEGPPDDPNCYINPINNYDIDVGNGGNVRIEVDYYMDCPGAADDGYVNISCQGEIDSKHTGTSGEGTLTITLWFDDDETFAVELCLLYMDWWNTDEISRIEKFSHCSTKEYEPPNSPPDRPDTPDGPTSIKVGVEHTYTSSATDPDGDQVYLMFDWGDGDDSGWLGPKTSGSTFSAKHSWSEPNGYDITCIAKDSPYLELSKWSYPLHISVTKSQPNP